MKKLAILSPINPFSYDSGARIRIYEISLGLINYYLDKGFDIDFIYLDDLKEDDFIRMPLFNKCNLISFQCKRSKLEAIFRMIFFHKSYRAAKFFSKDLEAYISKNINDYNVIYANFFDILSHFKLIKKNEPKNIFVDTHNDDYLWYESFEKKSFIYKIFGKINKYLYTRENQDLHKFITATVNVSKNDSISINTRFNINKSFDAPNGIRFDNNFFINKKISQKCNILFCGSLSVTMNEDAICWFGEEVLPILNHKKNNFQLNIVGRNPGYKVINLSKKDNIKLYSNVNSVKEFYNEANIVVLPFQLGGGSKLKLLEALNYNVPIVASNIGLVGCDDLKKFVFMEELNPNSFADTINQIVSNYSYALQLSKSGKEFIVDKYDWSSIVTNLVNSIDKSMIR